MTHEPQQTAADCSRPQRSSKFWTPEQDAIVSMLWARGESAQAVGLRVGKSRNAVIGRLHRLALPPRDTAKLSWRQQIGHLHAGLKYKAVLSPEDKAAQQARRKALQAERNTTTARIRVMNGAPQRKPVALPQPPPHDGPSYGILDVPDNGCRFAVTGHNVVRDEHRFCGRPVMGTTSWCDYHKSVVFHSVQP